MSIAPGWYQDPAEPTTQRWWDGEGWVGDPLPADATPPPGPPAATASGAIAPDGAAPGGAAPGGAASARPDRPDRPDPGQPEQPVPDQSQVPAGAQVSQTPPAAAGPAPRPPHPATAAPGQPQPPSLPHGLRLATLGARLVARLVDIGLVFALNVVVNGWFVYQYWNEISPALAEVWRRALAGETGFSNLPEVGDRAGTLQIIILIIAAALWFAYEVPAIANTGQTPGKRLLGIRVVRLEDDKPLGFGRSFRRWNTMGLPTLLWWCFGLGFLLQLVDAVFALVDRPLQQALHDKSAHTAVVAAANDPDEEAPDAPTDPS